MEVKINQVVLHLLDPGASEPVLSDRAMDMDADLYEYYTATLERAFASDEVKNCRFLPDSAFAAEMAQNQDFIDLSRRIAGVIFEQMLQYQAIPAGDLAVVDFTADGVPFYGVLKLNYRPGYTHHTELMGNGRFSSMVPQRTLLPGTPKADEAALIDRANGTVRLIEKKFMLDDRKDFYLSTRVFGCTEALQEKAKLKAVCETAVAAVKEAYPEPESLDDVPPFNGGTETAVELLVRNQAVDNQISVEDVRERIRENFPLAAPRFEEALAETGVQENDRVTVTPARIKKLVNRLRHNRAHPKRCLERVCAGAQMLNGAQVFKGMALFLERIIAWAFAFNRNGFRFNLKGLRRIRGKHELAFDGDCTTGIERAFKCIFNLILLIHYLNGFKAGAVHQFDETDGLARTRGLNPAGNRYGAFVLFRTANQFA